MIMSKLSQTPIVSASLGYLDDVIQPSETRTVMIKALGALLEKEEVRAGKEAWQYSTLGD